MSHARIESLIPDARAEPNPALGKIATEALLAYLLDPSQPWWRRETVARFWSEDLPAACVSPLLVAVTDASDTTEVRTAILEALCPACEGSDKVQLLTWLQGHRGKQPYGLEAKLLGARAKLGDITAVDPLARLAHDPWSHTRAEGIEGLRRLVRQLGDDAILRELGCSSYEDAAASAESPYLRVLAIRALEASGADLSRYLADPDTSVARYVYDALGDRSVDTEFLRELATSEAKPTQTRCWALLALHRRGESADAGLAALEEPSVVVPNVPRSVREAILGEYAPGERETDPRWLLEHAMTMPNRGQTRWEDEEPSPATVAALARLSAALTKRGLKPGPAISSGEQMQQGGGTYFILPIDKGGTLLSTLGPFATDDGNGTPVRQAEIRAAVEDAGLVWIDDELQHTIVTGLCVYFFGRRDPLSVRDLLFYWQD